MEYGHHDIVRMLYGFLCSIVAYCGRAVAAIFRSASLADTVHVHPCAIQAKQASEAAKLDKQRLEAQLSEINSRQEAAAEQLEDINRQISAAQVKRLMLITSATFCMLAGFTCLPL